MEEQTRFVPAEADGLAERNLGVASAYLEEQKRKWAAERRKGTTIIEDPDTGLKIEVDPEGIREDETEVI